MRVHDGPKIGPSAHHHGVQWCFGAGFSAPIHDLAPVIDDDDIGGCHRWIGYSARRDDDETRHRITDAHVARGPVDDAARQCFQPDLDHLLPQTLEQHFPLYPVPVSPCWLMRTHCGPRRRDRWLAAPRALPPSAGALSA